GEFIRLGLVKEKTISIGLIDSFHACHSYWLKIALQMRGPSVAAKRRLPARWICPFGRPTNLAELCA
ncbi:hypothetical protein ACOTDN_31675, partial [Achromobacter xylosoxidans]